MGRTIPSFRIAVELQFQLKTLIPEDLKYYVINRCYKEILKWLSTEGHPMIKKFSHFFKKKIDNENTDELILKLKYYKTRILNDLIVIEQNRLELMMIDRIGTKQSLNFSNPF